MMKITVALHWLFWAGKKLPVKTSCPMSGEYSGVMPQDPTACLTLSSDCTSADTVYSTVNQCSDPTNTYEGRWYEGHYNYILFKAKVDFFRARVRMCRSLGRGRPDLHLYPEERGYQCDRVLCLKGTAAAKALFIYPCYFENMVCIVIIWMVFWGYRT